MLFMRRMIMDYALITWICPIAMTNLQSPDLTVLFVSSNRNLLYTRIVEGITNEAFNRITRVEASS